MSLSRLLGTARKKAGGLGAISGGPQELAAPTPL